MIFTSEAGIPVYMCIYYTTNPGILMASSSLRQQRSTRGVAPDRYGDWQENSRDANQQARLATPAGLSSTPARPAGPASTPSRPAGLPTQSGPPGMVASPARPAVLAFTPVARREMSNFTVSGGESDREFDSESGGEGDDPGHGSDDGSELIDREDGEEGTDESEGEDQANAPLVNVNREVAGTVGEQALLQDLLDPDIPGPHPGPVVEDTDGWNKIDKLGVWECALCEFPTLLDIPRCYREVWARAVDRVLTVIQEAEGGVQLERGLKWLLILPKAVFRQGRRGGRAGKGLISQRINALIRGDWGSLLTLLETDCKLVAREDRTRGRQREVEVERGVEVERKRKNALLLLAKGQISKAVRTITSNGIGDMEDPVVREQMESKYPARVHPLPQAVSKGQCVDNLRGLKDLLLTLEGGVSAGTGGMRPEYLTCLAEVWNQNQMSKLEDFGMRYLNGNLPMWWYKVWITVATAPLYKTPARNSIRPVGVLPCLERQFRKLVTKFNKGALVNYFEPQQVVFSEAGAAKLVHSMRMLMEANPTFVLVKCDIKNAFNSISRSIILQVLEGEESLRHLAWHAALSLAPHGGLESRGKVWGQSGDGTTQGDPEAGAYFALGWHPQLRQLDSVVAAAGGAARAGCDDLVVAGPPDIVFPAIEEFWRDIGVTCCLQLERSKTEVYTSSGVLPAGTPEGLTRAGAVVGDEFLSGFVLYGVPVGEPRFVQHQLSLKVQDVAREVQEVLEVLQGEGQAIWTVIRSSTIMKLDYHLSLCYPSDMAEAASEMDQLLHNMLECATDLTIPRSDMGRGVECCPQPPVTRQQGKSYQDWMVGLPIRLGGMGMRSMVDVSLVAYIGSVEQALPHFVGTEGVCQQLTNILGGMRDSGSRWRELLASGSRTGVELQLAWNILRDEAMQSSQYLDRDMSGPLQVSVEGAGDGRVDGSTRRLTTTWLEDTRASVLKKALEFYPDQSARPVWANPQLDKLSQGWILAMPGPEGFSHAEFGETVARLLCLPSSCCQPKLGAPLGQHGLLVDSFGDSLMSVTNIPGDSFRHRHDKVKTVLNRFCLTSNIRAECEVFGAFRDLIPVQALEQEEDGLQRGRGRQGLLPDFRLELPTPLGQSTFQLAELKFIGAAGRCYPRSGTCARRKRGVERRAALLPGEYRRPLEKLDRKYYQVQQDQVGPLVRRLHSYGPLIGLVVGAFQEGSKDLHSLLGTLADSQLRAKGLARGREGTDQERSIILAGLRRALSMAAAKAYSSCLLDRVARVGEEHRQAAKRRALVKREEERIQEERRAYWHANVRARGVLRGQLVRM